MFRIYTTTKALADVQAKEGSKDFDEQSPWCHILKRQSELYATDYYPSIADGILDEMDIDSDSTLVYLLGQAAGIDIINADAFVDAVMTDYSRVLEQPGAAYYLDIPEEEAQNIRRRYGVICHSVSVEPNIKELSKHLSYNMEKGVVTVQWKDILSSPMKLPINCLCISDRYLFAWDGRKNKDQDEVWETNGMDNVIKILKLLLPQNLETDFHLTIFMQKDQVRGVSLKEWSKILFNRIDKIKEKRGLNYKILAQIVAFREKDKDNHLARYSDDITHERRIYSNYFLIEAGNGLNAVTFNNPDRKGVFSQKISMDFLYSHDLLESDDPNATSSEVTLRGLQKAVKTKWLPYWSANPETDEYWIASNDKEDEPCGVLDFKNRLFT